jgi:hypothetical protein
VVATAAAVVVAALNVDVDAPSLLDGALEGASPVLVMVVAVVCFADAAKATMGCCCCCCDRGCSLGFRVWGLGLGCRVTG